MIGGSVPEGGGTRCGMGAGPSMPLSTSRMPALFFVITPPVVAVPDMGIRSAHPDRFDEPGGFPAYVMRIRASGASHASYCVRYSSATPAISSLTYDTPSSLCSSRPVPKIFCPRRHESRTTEAVGGCRPYPLTPTARPACRCRRRPTQRAPPPMGCTESSQTRPQYWHAHAPDHGPFPG